MFVFVKGLLGCYNSKLVYFYCSAELTREYKWVKKVAFNIQGY